MWQNLFELEPNEIHFLSILHFWRQMLLYFTQFLENHILKQKKLNILLLQITKKILVFLRTLFRPPPPRFMSHFSFKWFDNKYAHASKQEKLIMKTSNSCSGLWIWLLFHGKPRKTNGTFLLKKFVEFQGKQTGFLG